jgi:N-acylneuraminate cytidylyltransferase
MKPLVIIPARGGSKGVPRKNIKLLNNKPLIGYTIEAAKQIFSDEVICVSTDDKEIKEIVENLGLAVPFLRPHELSSDSSGSYEVLVHALDEYLKNDYAADTIILLQPTSPFRTAEHIKQAIELYKKNEDCEMVVSVKETNSNPYYVHFEESEEGFLKKLMNSNYIRRQDCPKVYEFNGAIYIIDVAALKQKKMTEFTRVVKYQMDDASSHDIDTIFDWQFAEFLVEQKEK